MTSSKISEDIVALFEHFQKVPPLYNFDHIVANNPVPWIGYHGYPREKLIQLYFSRFDQMDLDSFLDSYKRCREAGELDVWLDRIKLLQSAKKDEYAIVATSVDFNDASIDPLARDEMKKIIWGIFPGFHPTTNLSELIHNFELEPHLPMYRMPLTRLLKNKKYLMAILKHALTVSLQESRMASRVMFVGRVLPMLDPETRNQFLAFLETAGEEYGGPFDLMQCGLKLKQKPKANISFYKAASLFGDFAEICRILADPNLLLYNLSTCGSTLKPKNRCLEMATGLLDDFATKACRFAETKVLKYVGGGRGSYSGAKGGAFNDSSSHNMELKNTPQCFLIDELVELTLSHLDWKTLLQSAPLVNKRFNRLTANTLIVQRSPDLVRYTREQSFRVGPYRMALTYPWNGLFSSPHHLIEYNVLHCQVGGHEIAKKWILSIHHGLGKKEKYSIPLPISRIQSFPDNALLNSSLRAIFQIRGGSDHFFDFDLSNNDILRVMDIFLDDAKFKGTILETVYEKVCNYSEDGLLYVLKHAKNGAKLFPIAKGAQANFNFAVAAILVLDDLDVPTDVKDAVKEYVLERYGVMVSVPMTVVELKRMRTIIGDACCCKSPYSIK